MENRDIRNNEITFLLVTENGTVYEAKNCTNPEKGNRFVTETGQVHVAKMTLATWRSNYDYRFILMSKGLDKFPQVKHCFWTSEDGYDGE